VSVVFWLPSVAESSTPVTVTVWAVSQLELVNVSAAGATVASPVSPDDTFMTTSLVGWALSTTVNVSVVTDSETTVEPPEAATVTPAVARIVIWLAGTAAISTS